jgi:hypothetical protein
LVFEDQDTVNEFGEYPGVAQPDGSVAAQTTIDRPVEPGSGHLDIFDDQGNYITSVAATDPAVKFTY